MHHLIPPAVHQWSIIRAGTGVAQSWFFLCSPSCRKTGAAVRGREVSSPPRSWTLEGRTNLLLSWKHPASPRWSALLPSLFQPSSWSCRAQGTTFLLVIAAKPELDRHSEDFQGSITTSCLEAVFLGRSRRLLPELSSHTGCAPTHLDSSKHLDFISPKQGEKPDKFGFFTDLTSLP